MTYRTVDVETLGLCEHCGELLSFADMPAESLNAPWVCPKCRSMLSHLSFGYATERGGKVRWVGPDGKWAETKPAEAFDLGSWRVTIRQTVFL
jgi:hypothetical protein